MAPKEMRTYRDFVSATAQRGTALKLVRWLLSTDRFPEFRLAKQYRAEAGSRDQGASATEVA